MMLDRVVARRRSMVCSCFFFQAEDGIRDYKVTGVQTCALPIFMTSRKAARRDALFVLYQWDVTGEPLASLHEGELDAYAQELADGVVAESSERSEERRVGKECRSRWSPYH